MFQGTNSFYGAVADSASANLKHNIVTAPGNSGAAAFSDLRANRPECRCEPHKLDSVVRLHGSATKLHRWHSGCAPAFQAGDGGSIPLRCSTLSTDCESQRRQTTTRGNPKGETVKNYGALVESRCEKPMAGGRPYCSHGFSPWGTKRSNSTRHPRRRGGLLRAQSLSSLRVQERKTNRSQRLSRMFSVDCGHSFGHVGLMTQRRDSSTRRAWPDTITHNAPGLGSNGEKRQERDGYMPDSGMPVPDEGLDVCREQRDCNSLRCSQTGYEPAADSRQVPNPNPN